MEHYTHLTQTPNEITYIIEFHHPTIHQNIVRKQDKRGYPSNKHVTLLIRIAPIIAKPLLLRC